MDSEPDDYPIMGVPQQETPVNDVEPRATEGINDTPSDTATDPVDEDNNDDESIHSPIIEVGPQAITEAHSIACENLFVPIV